MPWCFCLFVKSCVQGEGVYCRKWVTNRVEHIEEGFTGMPMTLIHLGSGEGVGIGPINSQGHHPWAFILISFHILNFSKYGIADIPQIKWQEGQTNIEQRTPLKPWWAFLCCQVDETKPICYSSVDVTHPLIRNQSGYRGEDDWKSAINFLNILFDIQSKIKQMTAKWSGWCKKLFYSLKSIIYDQTSILL